MQEIIYLHNVKYYETDKMGITHHSNYIRWMEEARIYYLEQIGCGYDKFESVGITSPVISVSCKYKKPSTFNDDIAVHVKLTGYNGVKFTFTYEMINTRDNCVCACGTSEHCFINESGSPILIKRSFPEFNDIFIGLLTK